MRLNIRRVYLFWYNLLQFCGHTWTFSNMTARFFTFGGDALADTFYTVGVVMSLCLELSFLELFHIADGIEEGWFLPRFVQVLEKNALLFVVIIGLEEFQSKPIVCVQFFLWNILDLPRYPYGLLCLMGTPSLDILWARYTLPIPIYMLSVASEGMTVYQALPYFETKGTNSQLTPPSTVDFPIFLKAYLLILAASGCVTVWQLVNERKQQLQNWNQKKRKSR